MTDHINMSFNRSTKHRGEHGNLVADPLQVPVLSSYVAGDVVVLDTGPWESLYLSVRLARAALTAGLIVDVGVRSIDGTFVDPTYFGTVDTSVAGVDELIVEPKEVVDSVTTTTSTSTSTISQKVNHEIILTLNGTLTPDESFWVICEKLHGGAPL